MTRSCRDNAFRTTIRIGRAPRRTPGGIGGRDADGRKAPRLIGVGGLALGLLSLAAEGAAPSHAEDCKYFSALPDDCARRRASTIRWLARLRYEEIDLFARIRSRNSLYVSVYNTTGLNGGDDFDDSARRRSSKIWTRRRSPNNTRRFQRGSPLRTAGRWTGSLTGSAQSGTSMASTRNGWGTAAAPRARPQPKAASTAYRTTLPARTAVVGFKKDRKSISRRSQGADLGDGLLHGQGNAGSDDRQARLPRRSPQAAAGLEVPHRNVVKELILDLKLALRASSRTTRATSTI